MRLREQENPKENQVESIEGETSEPEVKYIDELSETFKEAWDNSHREGDPDVSFTFFLGQHGQAQDANPKLREELLDADIYMPEAVMWDERYKRALSAVSEGILETVSDTEYAQAKERELHGTGVKVLLPDLPREHPRAEELDLGTLDKKIAEIRKMKFEEAIQGMKEYGLEYAAKIRAREKEIVKNIPKLIRQALDEDEDLRRKSAIKIVLVYGSAHTTLHQAILKAGEDSSREMRYRPRYTFSHAVEFSRNNLFGVGKPEKQTELAARAMVSNLMFKVMKPEFNRAKASSEEVTDIIRTSIDMLTMEELRDIWDTNVDSNTLLPLFKKLEEKGFTVPSTRKEIDEFFQKKE